MDDEEKTLSATSGAAKRRKEKQLENERSKLTKITHFFSVKSTSDEGGGSRNAADEGTTKTDNGTVLSEDVNLVSAANAADIEDETNVASFMPVAVNQDVDLQNKDAGINESVVSLEDFVNDLGYFQNQILSSDVKRRIINTASSRPTGPFSCDSTQNYRKFSTVYYKKETPYGLIDRQWLCYSKVLDAVYCEPCWLFSNSKMDRWRSTGIRDWKGLSKKILTHETSQSHLSACYVYEKWKQNNVIDKDLEEEIKHEACFWAQVLERLINITLTLAKNSLAFRGHRESLSETYNGNFLSTVQLLAKYDGVLQQVMNLPKGHIKYLSSDIQNELISILSSQVKSQIISKIKKVPYFAILMDTTQDLSKVDQLSQIVRYVEVERNELDEPIALTIKESFLGFTAVHNHSAAGLSEKIIQGIEDSGLNLDKCRGQGYDGAAAMSGIYGGVQALIKQKQPKAEYVHCAAHNLNLVIGDCVKCCVEIQTFFAVLEEIYDFFGSSLVRWDILANITEESQTTLKKLNPTRWAGRVTSLIAVKRRFLDILKALDKIILMRKKNDKDRKTAENIKKKMCTFEFVIESVIMEKIMSHVNIASKLLQAHDMDISRAANCLKNVYDTLSKKL